MIVISPAKRNWGRELPLLYFMIVKSIVKDESTDKVKQL